MSNAPPIVTDATIVGGGIAGLWLANLLSQRGYGVLLCERDALGAGQTLASQGMIHGGLKYALGASLTGSSEAIAGMPARWRACLSGAAEVDLTGLKPLSERYHMFAESSTLGALTTFFASKSLRGRIEKLDAKDLPREFGEFGGHVYALNDFVLDTPALLAALAEPVRDILIAAEFDGERCDLGDETSAVTFELLGRTVTSQRLILCAGAGNQRLLDSLQLHSPAMQLRPLHQVVVRHPDLPPMYAHCLTGIRKSEPRLTITSHPDGAGWLWYLGGALATGGVGKSVDELCSHAERELQICVPWLDWQNAVYSTLAVDRAEPAQATGHRPEQAFAEQAGNCIVCWPTKLSLVPDLGDRVLQQLDPPRVGRVEAPDLPLAEVGSPPWNTP